MKKQGASERELKGTIKKLRSELDRAEVKTDRWKKKARLLEKTADDAEAQNTKLKKRLRRARSVENPSTSLEVTIPAVVQTNGNTPDASWTVVQLRAEARSRGLGSLSNKSKAQLLAALR